MYQTKCTRTNCIKTKCTKDKMYQDKMSPGLTPSYITVSSLIRSHSNQCRHSKFSNFTKKLQKTWSKFTRQQFPVKKTTISCKKLADDLFWLIAHFFHNLLLHFSSKLL